MPLLLQKKTSKQQQQQNKNTQQKSLPLPQTFPDACRLFFFLFSLLFLQNMF